MENRNNNQSVVIGGIIITLGAVFLFRNLGYFDFNISRYLFNWYSWLILAGVITLSKRNGQENVGYTLLAIGGVFLLMDLNIIPGFSIRTWWPLILVAIGVSYILKGQNSSVPDGVKPDGGIDFINDTNIFSGGEYHISSENFKGGRITNIFGGGEYNLTRSKLSETSDSVLEVFVLFGGIELVVPSDWEVKSDVTALFGGFSNKKRSF
ncbi:MAG: putative membrane protein, partial [Spirosomataceae bacterium]